MGFWTVQNLINPFWILYIFKKMVFGSDATVEFSLISTDFGTALTLGNPSQSHAPKGPPVGPPNETASIEL